MEKRKQNILLILMGVLILIELTITTYMCVIGKAPVDDFVNLIALVGIAIYGFWLYKKPHGNLLKYVIFLSALAIIVTSVLSIYEWGDSPDEVFPPIIAACLLFYVAGRLNRIDQNKYLLPIIAVILLAGRISEVVSISVDPDPISMVRRYLEAPREVITILTLMFAYFARYKEHKEAGISDK